MAGWPWEEQMQLNLESTAYCCRILSCEGMVSFIVLFSLQPILWSKGKLHKNIPGSVWLYVDTLAQLGCLLIFFLLSDLYPFIHFKPRILAKSVCRKYLPKFHIFSFVTWFLWYKLPLGACLVFETQCHCIAQTGLEITVSTWLASHRRCSFWLSLSSTGTIGYYGEHYITF